ncbi:MAG: TetR/AcrR family transcriptional regulator [Ramlibacter sp.]
MPTAREKTSRPETPAAAPRPAARRPAGTGAKAAGKAAGKTAVKAGTGGSALETRALILHHAARLLRENGYAAVSLRQIAADVNIKAGSIYYHFASKEEILFHVLEEGLRQIVREVDKAVAGLPPGTPFRERLRVVVRSHLHGLLQVGEFPSANIRIYGQVPEEVRRRHYVARRAFADWWDRFFAEAVKEGSLRADLNLSVVRVFVVAALNWTVEWYDPKRGSFDALADQIYTIIADGLVLDQRP